MNAAVLRTRTKIVGTTLLALALAGCTRMTVTGPSDLGMTVPVDAVSGEGLVTETRPVAAVTGVSVSGVARVLIEQAATDSLTVTAAPDVLPQLGSVIRDGWLMLGPTNGIQVSTTRDVVYRLRLRALDELRVSGVVGVEATGLARPRLAVEVGGVSVVRLEGTTGDVQVVVAGTSQYEAADLLSNTARVQVGATSRAVVRVRERLQVAIAAGGVVEYYGSPLIVREPDGGGVLRRR